MTTDREKALQTSPRLFVRAAWVLGGREGALGWRRLRLDARPIVGLSE